jgi:hypothetical protein
VQSYNACISLFADAGFYTRCTYKQPKMTLKTQIKSLFYVEV